VIQQVGVPVEEYEALRRDFETLQQAAAPPPEQVGVPVEEYEALRRDFETLQQAGVPIEEYEALRIQFIQQQEETVLCKQEADDVVAEYNRLSAELQVLQAQGPPPTLNNLDGRDEAFEEKAALLDMANQEKMELQQLVIDLQAEAEAKQQARAAEVYKWQEMQEWKEKLIECEDELQRASQINVDNERRFGDQIQELEQALQDQAAQGKALSPVQDPRVPMLQQEVDVATERFLEVQSLNDALQRQLNSMEAMQENAQYKNQSQEEAARNAALRARAEAEAQEQQILDLQAQLNKVLMDLEDTKRASQFNASVAVNQAVEEQIVAERQQGNQKLSLWKTSRKC